MTIFFVFCAIFIFSVFAKEPRVVNIALETSLLFEPNDLTKGKGMIQQIRRYVDKLYHSLEPNRIKYRHTNTLPNVLNNLGNIFLNLTDEKLKNITNIIRSHLDKYKFGRRSTYKELFDSNFDKKIGKIDGAALQENIRNLFTYGNPQLENLARRFDRFYSQDDLVKLTKSIRKFESYLRNDKDPSNILREGLDFAIFDKYNKLNDSSKAEVLMDLKNISKSLNNNTLALDDSKYSNDNNIKSGKMFGANNTDIEHDRMHHEHTIETSISSEASNMELSEDVFGSRGNDPHMHHRHSHVKESQ